MLHYQAKVLHDLLPPFKRVVALAQCLGNINSSGRVGQCLAAYHAIDCLLCSVILILDLDHFSSSWT